MSSLYHEPGHQIGGRLVLLATTAYESPDAAYTWALHSSVEALHRAGIGAGYLLLAGNCHVDDARNKVVSEFLQTDATELIFLDADVTWRPEQLIELCRHDVDIVGGVYPYRREDSRDSMPVRMKAGAEVNDDGLLEVEGMPTGFLRIKRRVFELLAECSQSYKGKEGETIPLLFERTLQDGTRWGGDLNFCNRWRGLGGKVYAIPEMRLGHVAKTVLRDSLAAFQRRTSMATLAYVCGKIRAGTETLADVTEAIEYVGNVWGAREDVLMLAIKMARQADGPIIETGSGLSTILMAAATEQTVYCIEHHGLYAAQLKQMCAEAGVGNVGLCMMPIKDGYYAVEDFNGLPERFALGLNDGPPRSLGSRTGFFSRFQCARIICDDADDAGYREYLESWADANGYDITIIEPRAAMLLPRPLAA